MLDPNDVPITLKQTQNNIKTSHKDMNLYLGDAHYHLYMSSTFFVYGLQSPKVLNSSDEFHLDHTKVMVILQ